MNEHRQTEESDKKPASKSRAEAAKEQRERTRIKVQSDVRAGIVQGNGSLYP